MILWQWIVFGFVSSQGGIVASPRISVFVQENPKIVSYGVICFTALFTSLLYILLPKGVARFYYNVILADRWRLRSRVTHLTHWCFLLAICISTTFSLSALLQPIRFNTTRAFSRTELDFTATAADCVEWFNGSRIEAAFSPCLFVRQTHSRRILSITKHSFIHQSSNRPRNTFCIDDGQGPLIAGLAKVRSSHSCLRSPLSFLL